MTQMIKMLTGHVNPVILLKQSLNKRQLASCSEDKSIKLSWNDFYQDKGIKWELIISETSETIKTYSFRFKFVGR